MIVATAALMAWLLVELARFAFGDLRFAKVREGSLQVAAQETPVRPTSSQRPPVEPTAPAREHESESVLYDEADVEQAVRDRLYGGGRPRRS